MGNVQQQMENVHNAQMIIMSIQMIQQEEHANNVIRIVQLENVMELVGIVRNVIQDGIQITNKVLFVPSPMVASPPT